MESAIRHTRNKMSPNMGGEIKDALREVDLLTQQSTVENYMQGDPKTKDRGLKRRFPRNRAGGTTA